MRGSCREAGSISSGGGDPILFVRAGKNVLHFVIIVITSVIYTIHLPLAKSIYRVNREATPIKTINPDTKSNGKLVSSRFTVVDLLNIRVDTTGIGQRLTLICSGTGVKSYNSESELNCDNTQGAETVSLRYRPQTIDLPRNILKDTSFNLTPKRDCYLSKVAGSDTLQTPAEENLSSNQMVPKRYLAQGNTTIKNCSLALSYRYKYIRILVNQKTGRRHMSSNSKDNNLLNDLDKTYRDLEDKISSLIIKELNKQYKLPSENRTWITDLPDSTFFQEFIPKLVQLKQFLIAIKVSKKFIHNLDINLVIDDDFNYIRELNFINKELLRLAVVYDKNSVGKKITLPPSVSHCELSTKLKEFKSLTKSDKQNISLNIKSEVDPKLISNNPIYTASNKPEPVCRELVDNKDISGWDNLINELEIESLFESVIFKIHAIDELFRTNERFTPGVDNVAVFKKINLNIKKPDQRQIPRESLLRSLGPSYAGENLGQNTLQVKRSQSTEYHKILQDAINEVRSQHPAFQIQSVSKGNNILAIQRKGKIQSPNEILRAYLNNTEMGRKLVKLSITEYTLLKNDP